MPILALKRKTPASCRRLRHCPLNTDNIQTDSLKLDEASAVS